MSYSSELKEHLQSLSFKRNCCMESCAAGFDGLPYTATCEHCTGAFLRGVFFRFGYLSPLEKETLLTFDFPTVFAYYVCDVLNNSGLDAKVTERKGKYQIYIKKLDEVCDLLSMIGATKYSLQMMQWQVDKQCNEDLNRQFNAETANLSRTANASATQLLAINKLIVTKKLNTLPEELQETANLRLSHPESNLSDLCKMFHPPISKSGLNHRLQKIIAAADSIE